MSENLNFIIWIGATFRITHLLVFDTITLPLRKLFFDFVDSINPVTGAKETKIEYKGQKIRRFFGKLLSCHWCTGFWVAVAVVSIGISCPGIQLIWTIFAVAGLSSWLETKLNE